MKVLVVLPSGVLGGAERVMFSVISHLIKQKHDVTLYVMSRGVGAGWDELKSNPYLTVVAKEFSSEKKSLLSFVFNVFFLSRKAEYDYVISTHTHVNGALSLMRRMRILKCKKLVSRESTFIFERFYGIKLLFFKFLYKFCYGQQDLLVFQTPEMKSLLLAKVESLRALNAVVLRNPVDAERIEFFIEQEKGYLPDALSICACGRLVSVKAFDVLIRAFGKISNKHERASLWIIGDGPERKNLEELAVSLGVKQRVKFWGRVENPYFLFGKCDLGVVSSKKEGFPNVLLEMMASGTKQLLSTPCSDGIQDLPSIIVTNGFSSEEMAGLIDKALRSRHDHANTFFDYVQNFRSPQVYWSDLYRAAQGEQSVEN